MESHKIDNANNIESIVECFQDLNQEDLEFILHNKTQIEYQKGDTIFKQGAFASHVLFVNQGLVKIYVQTGKDKQLNIRLAKHGDFMAFATIFGNEKYQYSAVALVDSIICMINKDALKQLLFRNPGFAMQITSKNSFIESRYLEIIKNVTYKQMRGKLASIIIYLASDEYKDEEVFRFLNRQDIADFASISLESTVKFIKEFEADGLILTDGKNIILKNKDKLIEMATKG